MILASTFFGLRCAALLVLAVVALPAAATLSGVGLGTHVTGPTCSVADLAGRVVLFDYWGVNCPPCVASIHHLAGLQATYGRDNLIIIANHCQGGPATAIKATWSGKAGNDLVTVVDAGQLPGSNVTGIPRCFLFDHRGTLIYDGAPLGVDAKLEEAMRATPGALVAGRDFTKLVREAAALGAQKACLTPSLKAVRKAAAADEPLAKDEAAFLLGRVDAWTTGALERVAADRIAQPARANETVARMAALRKGDELAAPFEALADELKKDKTFQTELRAAAALAAIKQAAGAVGLDSDPEAAKARKSNREKIEGIAAGLAGVRAKFAETAAAREAGELAEEWKL